MKKILLYLAASFCFLLISNSVSAQVAVISYATPITLPTNQLTTITPTNTGGASTNWSFSGTLPTGLTFDPATGDISGTPTTVTAASTIMVTANNGSGNSNTFSLSIAVATGTSVAPVITYDTPDTYPVGTAVSLPVTNSNSANTVSYALTGTLPAGLTLNTVTGLISGTTTTITASVTVTITASTGGATGTTTVQITVTAGPPVISYTTPDVLTIGTATTLSPTNTGGAVATGGNSYGAGKAVITGAAGAYGMAVDASGDVFVTNPLTNTITEYSAAGAVTSFTVTGGPVGIVFDAAGNAYVLDQTTNSVVEYAAGSNFTAPTTIITGLSTPTGIAISGTNLYVANSGNGTITKYTTAGGAPTLTITANTGTNFFTQRGVSGGIAVDAAGNIYVVDNVGFGVKVDEYNGTTGAYIGSSRQGRSAISGIYIDPTSGNIELTSTGRRRVTVSTANFAANVGTETGFSSPRGVVSDALGDLFVSDYTTGTVTEYPIVKGYTISGTLPPGLTFNTTTGVISGTPTTTFAATTYTITAYNAGGSGSTTVTISCPPTPPVISYTPNPAVYAVGAVINLPITHAATPAVIAAGYSTGTALTGATLSAPWGVTKDAAGDIWVINSGNNSVTEYGPTGTFIKTVAITGTAGTLSGITINGTAIYLSSTTGGVYTIATTATTTAAATRIANTGDNLGGIVYNPATGLLDLTNETTGAIYSLSTTAGFFNFPRTLATAPAAATGITVDASGNIYVLTLTGTLTEYSSTGAFERTVLTGVGTAAYGVTLDAAGDIFISDSGSGTVKEYNAAGTLISTTTAAGGARGLVTDASGDIYVAGFTSNAVTEYTPTTYYVLTGTPALPTGLTFNPLTGTFSDASATVFGPLTFTVTAYSSSGTATTTVTIQCTNNPIFTYTTPDTYSDGVLITPLSPTVTANGPVVSYSASSLPPGLTINTTTGVISGTPTTVTPATAYLITGTNASGGVGTFTITITTLLGPPAFTYAGPQVYVDNTAIAPLSPVNTGGTPLSYAINIALPAGLTFNTATGQITGTPTVVSPATLYTITATNAAGSSTATVTISCVSIPIISYTTPDVYTVGVLITSLSPVNTGSTPISYAIGTILPAGLTFNTATGVISGTPTTVSAATNYSITATNANGTSLPFLVNITVNPPAPVITYDSPQEYTVGTPIDPLFPTVVSGTVVSYSTTGLPPGLTLDPVTGEISGTPTTASAQTSYTVTATNAGGNGSATILIQIDALGPVFVYTSPDIYPLSVAITPLVPANSGSTPVSYTISGTLPTGLTFSTTTGIISGTPTVVAAAANYTIIGTDAAGLQGFFVVNIACQVANNWLGTTSSDWNVPTNWSTGAVPIATGIANIGSNVPFTNPAIVGLSGGTVNVGTIVMGTNGGKASGFTVNAGFTLNVTGAITYQSDANSLAAYSTAIIAGAGTVNAAGINVTANTNLAPGSGQYFETLQSSVTSLNLSGNISLTSGETPVTGLDLFSPEFDITGGVVALGGAVQTSNTTDGISIFQVITGTLQIAGTAGLSGLDPVNGTNTINFDNPGATVEYSGTVDQTYYTDLAIPGLSGGGPSYHSIKFSGSGIKSPNGTNANNLFIDGDFTNTISTDPGDFVDLSLPSVYFDGTTQNIYAGTGAVAGTAGTTFYNTYFEGTGTTTIQSGAAFVATSGVFTLSGTKTLAAGTQLLTLTSDATGSSTVAAIPTGCSVTGTVNVQRFITGGANHRGYRLVSSPVHVGATTLASMNYLINSVYLKGTTGIPGGFDGAGNPNLYLYRENLVPSNATFISGNYRGVNQLYAGTETVTAGVGAVLTNTNYLIDGDAGTFNVPEGGGYLLFFRGARSAATLAQETVLSYVPVNATLTAVGTLNQGPVKPVDWYTPTSPSLGVTTVSGSAAIEGMNLIGNPYASSIDWDTYDGSGSIAGAGISAPNILGYIYVLDPVSQNFNVYLAGTGGAGTLANNSNIIPSGEGFFVRSVSNTAADLVFNEAAKTNAQATAAAGNLFLGTPAQAAISQSLHIRVTRDSLTSTVNTDGIMIIFNKSASMKYAAAEDAAYKGGGGTVSLTSMSADSISLAINQMPFPALQAQTIPLVVKATESGIYQLNMTPTASIPALYTMYLKDAYKQDSLDVRANPIYSFNIDKSDAGTFGAGRFSLVIAENPALMVHLLDFNATKATGGSQVVWKTENEQNYTNFTVQRSTDGGVTFAVLGGFASSAQSTYSFLDQNPAMKANQYRLMMQDLNGTITYSKIVTLIYGNGDSPLTAHLNVYPNPSADVINLSIPSNVTSGTQTSLSGLQTLATTPGLVSTTSGSTSSSYDIKIIGITGAVIKSATSSSTNWQGSVSGLAPGTYIIQVVNNSDKSLVGRSTFVKL